MLSHSAISPPPDTRSNLLLATIVVSLGWALTLFGFWPGWMSFDSGDQYAQVLSGRYNDVHPPLMAVIWAVTNRIVPGPGGIFALHALAFWIGMVATLALRLRGWRLVLIALSIGFWPPVALMLGHVWKDVGMTAALLIATAAAMHWRRDGSRYWWALAFTALMVAAAYRHNAIAACLPLLALLFHRDARNSRASVVLRFSLAALALFATPSLLTRIIGAEHKLAWPAVALFDIAAVSIATDEQRVPLEVSAPSLTVSDLKTHFTPWANPSIFETGKIKLSFFVPYGPRERNAVAGAWWRAVREQPRAWFSHRARLSKYLLFGPPAEAPRELVIVPLMMLPPNAGLNIAAADNLLARNEIAFADRWWRSPIFWAAPYLLLGLFVAMAVWRSSEGWRPALVLCASAWAYALPLALIAGAAEARYLLWTQVITLIAAACVFIPAGRIRPPP